MRLLLMFIRDLFPVESASLPIGVFVSGIHGGSKIAKYLSIEGAGLGFSVAASLRSSRWPSRQA